MRSFTFSWKLKGGFLWRYQIHKGGKGVCNSEFTAEEVFLQRRNTLDKIKAATRRLSRKQVSFGGDFVTTSIHDIAVTEVSRGHIK